MQRLRRPITAAAAKLAQWPCASELLTPAADAAILTPTYISKLWGNNPNCTSYKITPWSLSQYHSSLFTTSCHAGAEVDTVSKKEQQQPPPTPAPSRPQGLISGGFLLSSFPPERVRNFSIIAHIDHGKSTLADRLMELTGAIKLGARQYLDKLQVERERGITVKAQTASLVYLRPSDGHHYLLNLVDTPGHVDFSYEVSRSLAACQGAVLLVDAAQGVQAQTVANFFLAFDQNLAVVPVLNKIDMPAAEPDRVAEQMREAFDIEPEECLRVSAKTGLGLEGVLEAVVERVPPPGGDPKGNLRLLLFDAFHDEFK